MLNMFCNKMELSSEDKYALKQKIEVKKKEKKPREIEFSVSLLFGGKL